MKLSYFHLNPKCGYCMSDVTCIRITQDKNGEIKAVATLCSEHAIGEALKCKNDGHETVGMEGIL